MRTKAFKRIFRPIDGLLAGSGAPGPTRMDTSKRTPDFESEGSTSGRCCHLLNSPELSEFERVDVHPMTDGYTVLAVKLAVR
jgi:hypothetical protein